MVVCVDSSLKNVIIVSVPEDATQRIDEQHAVPNIDKDHEDLHDEDPYIDEHQEDLHKEDSSLTEHQEEDVSSIDESFQEEEKNIATVRAECDTIDPKEYVERIEKLEELLQKSEKLRAAMKLKHKRLQRKSAIRIARLQNEVRMKKAFPATIEQLLNADQIQLLQCQYKKIPKWCNASLTKAYQLKFACGYSGYRELLNQGFPLPSLRTLNRKLENLKFQSGILHEVFDFLNIKVSQFKDARSKDCLIVLDEISITSGTVFDTSTNTYLGRVTLPEHDKNEVATHGLVFMLAGIGHRWKQNVAYYYTGPRTNGSAYRQIILSLIENAEAIGLFVHGIISDMGAPNQAMWKSFNIRVSKYSDSNKCPHPLDSRRDLFFFHDSSHALKNFKEGMLNHDFITIPDKYVEKHNLPTNKAVSKHFQELLDAQKDLPLSLAPKLREEYLDRGKHFQKMRVKSACNVLSHEVGTALKFLAEEHSKPEYQTTSWLVEKVAHWFKLLSARKAPFALSKGRLEKYNEAIQFLYEFIDLITSVTFGVKASWKPFQTGIILTTKSFIELSAYLIDEKNYEYVLGGRFTQDCLENLFSVLRSKHSILNALQFKNNLKIVTISHYMRRISTSNYNQDDRDFIPDFLDLIPKVTKQIKTTETIPNEIVPDAMHSQITLKEVDRNILNHVAGYIISSIIKNQKTCKECVQCVGSKKADLTTYNRLTSVRCYKTETLFFVNKQTFMFFMEMEQIFRSYVDSNTENSTNLHTFFTQKFNNISYLVPDCHKLKSKIISRYALFRLKINSKKLKPQRKSLFSSKTMAMHYRAN